jgi:hypothetical protein
MEWMKSQSILLPFSYLDFLLWKELLFFLLLFFYLSFISFSTPLSPPPPPPPPIPPTVFLFTVSAW